MAILSYRDLTVWQKAMDLAIEVYRLTQGFPKTEEYRLTAQITRAAVSVPANIAEGHARGTRKDYANFISIANGSLAEVETFLTLSVRLGLALEADVEAATALASEIGRMLATLRTRLKQEAGSQA